MNWFILTMFAIELGFAPMYTSLNVSDSDFFQSVTEDIGYVTFEAEVTAFEFIFIGGAVKTYIQGTDKATNFHPFESDYLFNTGMRFNQLEVGWRHLCLHPTRPYEIIYQPQQSTNSFYDEWYARIEYKF